MDAKKIGSCIKRNRNKHKISLEELAKQTEIRVEQLLKYENGDELPKYKELVAISKAIDVPLVFLLKGGGEGLARIKTDDGNSVCRWYEY